MVVTPGGGLFSTPITLELGSAFEEFKAVLILAMSFGVGSKLINRLVVGIMVQYPVFLNSLWNFSFCVILHLYSVSATF